MNGSLSQRAAQAQAEKLAADTEARARNERAAELERQRKLQELQVIPSAHEARKSANKWFAAMGVDPVNTQVTEHRHNRKTYNDDGYIATSHEWDSTVLTWQLDGHSYYGDYREYSIMSEERSNYSGLWVEVTIKTQDNKSIRRPANTLVELGAALEEEA